MSPMRMRGPCKSPRMATGLFASAASRRMSWMVAACSSCVPCEKFTRATSMPLSISARNTSSERDAGPIVATILARGANDVTSARRDETAAERLRLAAEPREERVEGLLERRQTVGQQFVRDSSQRNADRFQLGKLANGVVHPRIDRAPRFAVIAKGVEGRRWQRVHGVRPN